MDNQTLNLEVFLESLTEDQAAMCERDEEQLAEIFAAGWSEAMAIQFHRAMLCGRAVSPDVTVEGTFEVACMLGLSFLSKAEIVARLHQKREGDEIVWAVQRRNSKDACIVSTDVAALAKQRKPRPRKRGVRGV